MQIVVYSYNIHSGKNILFKNTLPKIIRYLRNSKADLIGLQEVQNNSKYGMQFIGLERSLKMHSYYGMNLKIADGYYGNALFSRFPFISNINHPMPGAWEQRGIIQTTLNADRNPIHCFNTHLALGKKERITQMAILKELVDQLSQPTIVLGDFNTSVPPVFHHLKDIGTIVGKRRHATVKPIKRRIDYIFVSHHFKVLDYHVEDVPYSDHLPIRAVLELG